MSFIRRGFRSKPRTTAEIVAVASAVRRQVAPELRDTDAFPVHRLAEVSAIEVEGIRLCVDVYPSAALDHASTWAVSWWDPASDVHNLTLCEVTWREVTGNVPRSRWTVAHELGHVCLHHEEMRRGLFMTQTREEAEDPTPHWHLPIEDTERQADTFAAELLMPARGVLGLEAPSVAQMRMRYFVSARAARLRLEELLG